MSKQTRQLPHTYPSLGIYCQRCGREFGQMIVEKITDRKDLETVINGLGVLLICEECVAIRGVKYPNQ